MKTLSVYSIVIILLTANCTPKPEPILYGKDLCHACKMTIMDKKFGAEIVTKKGKIYKFDDLNCMVSFYQSSYEDKNNIAQILVVDFPSTENLIDATTATYVFSNEIRSPMASGMAAFRNSNDINNYNTEWKGKILSWEQVIRK